MKGSSTLSTASDDSRRSSGDTAFLSHHATKEEMKQAVIKRLDIRSKNEGSTSTTSSGRCPSSRLISSSTRSISSTSSSYILDYTNADKSSFEVKAIWPLSFLTPFNGALNLIFIKKYQQ